MMEIRLSLPKSCIAISIAAILFGCGKVENFNSTDNFIYGEVVLEGTPQFQAAAAVIRKRCTNCHMHAEWAKFNEDDYFASGLVEAGSIADSPIYNRNKGATEGDGVKNMPTEGRPAMTAAELDLLVAWITSL